MAAFPNPLTSFRQSPGSADVIYLILNKSLSLIGWSFLLKWPITQTLLKSVVFRQTVLAKAGSLLDGLWPPPGPWDSNLTCTRALVNCTHIKLEDRKVSQ